MKVRPILFQGEMIRRLLSGDKTQTRRVMTPQPAHVWGFGVARSDPEYFTTHVRYPGGTQPDPWVRCPYGKPGDRLWVRETWNEVETLVDGVWRHDRYVYRATPGDYPGAWRPSIFMPRAASRITLEITEVRVERVEDISEADAIAEGIQPVRFDDNPLTAKLYVDAPTLYPAFTGKFFCQSARESYQQLWDSINAKRGYGWAVNPWVYTITFRVVPA